MLKEILRKLRFIYERGKGKGFPSNTETPAESGSHNLLVVNFISRTDSGRSQFGESQYWCDQRSVAPVICVFKTEHMMVLRHDGSALWPFHSFMVQKQVNVCVCPVCVLHYVLVLPYTNRSMFYIESCDPLVKGS